MLILKVQMRRKFDWALTCINEEHAHTCVEVHSSETQCNKNSCPKPSLNTKQKQAQPHKLEITAMQMRNFHTTVARSTHIQFGNNRDENAEFSHDTSRIKNRPGSNQAHILEIATHRVETWPAQPKQRHMVGNSCNENAEFSHGGWSFFLHEKMTKYLVL